MQSIHALSLTLEVNNWLATSRHPRILHVFDHACNLINKRREVLSIVTPQIGNGPFNLLVENDIFFSGYLNLQSPISISVNQLTLGDLIINIENAKHWSPRPDWERLHAIRENIINQLASLPITQSLDFNLKFSNLSSALVRTEISSVLTITSQLAGLGIGLTPAGDDFLLGAIYATWIIHTQEQARAIAEAIARTAIPLTTSLSAAWLRAGARGEAGTVWHDFFKALELSDDSKVKIAVERLLSIGHTSGADALAGFVGMLT
jgi:Protein of unknown function (DUF2877)